MARPREFELDQALRDAAEVFRTKGYHAASLEDLIEGTGLAKGSLYKAFHDKKSLFLGALELYASESRDRFRQTLEAPGSPREALRQTFLGYLERIRSGWGRAGCLITNTAVELGAQDPEIADRVALTIELRVALFEAAIRRAQAAGEVAPGADPRALAEFLELTVQGLRVLGKSGASNETLLRSVDLALGVLG